MKTPGEIELNLYPDTRFRQTKSQTKQNKYGTIVFVLLLVAICVLVGALVYKKKDALNNLLSGDKNSSKPVESSHDNADLHTGTDDKDSQKWSIDLPETGVYAFSH